VAKSGGEKCIVALDKLTGEIRWTSSGFYAGPEYSSCIAFDFEGQPLICTGTRSGLVCVDATNGKLLWSNDFCTNNTANCPTPVYSDGHVFWSNGYGKGSICMKLKTDGNTVTADVAWSNKEMVCQHGGYIVHRGHIFGNHNGGWSCLNLKTGEQLWDEEAVGKGSLCYADGMLYLFSETDGVAGLATCSPEGLEMKGQMQVEGSGRSWAHPVVIGGRLYLRYAGNLYCFDVRG
jgi:outer membrane protein assembly factor BamB